MEAAQHLQERTYPATFAKFAGLALGVFSIILGALLVMVHPKQGAPNALLTDQIPQAAVTAIMLSFFLQLARCRVTATTTALIVVHPLRRYVFPWSQVTDVMVGPDGGMRIVLRDRASFAVFCFGGSVIGMITRGIRARKARDGIKAVMRLATSDKPVAPVTSSPDLQWKITLAIWAAATALGVIGWLLAPHHVLT
jgi:hypothetical protein